MWESHTLSHWHTGKYVKCVIYVRRTGRKEMFYLTMHSTHFILQL